MSDHYDPNHNRVIGHLTTAAFSDATTSFIDTHSAVKVLAITVTAEIVAFAMFIIANEKVAELVDEYGVDYWFYGSTFFFFNGFFVAFAVYRLIANKWPHRGVRVLIWLVSIVAGALNIAVFFGLSGFVHS